jgi:hypothetical protein
MLAFQPVVLNDETLTGGVTGMHGRPLAGVSVVNSITPAVFASVGATHRSKETATDQNPILQREGDFGELREPFISSCRSSSLLTGTKRSSLLDDCGGIFPLLISPIEVL